MDFKTILSEKRLPVATPDSIVDSDGRAAFGTFDREFKEMNFLDVDKQCPFLPNWFNWFRLTQWEAVEINLKDCILLMGVSDMGLTNTGLICFYDKKKRKVTSWREYLFKTRKQIKVAKNLLDGEITESHGDDVKIRIINHFEQGEAYVTGEAFLEDVGFINYHFDLERISKPCIVSIPFDKNKPLYSQKDFFKCSGYIEFNGKRYESDEFSTASLTTTRVIIPVFLITTGLQQWAETQ